MRIVLVIFLLILILMQFTSGGKYEAALFPTPGIAQMDLSMRITGMAF